MMMLGKIFCIIFIQWKLSNRRAEVVEKRYFKSFLNEDSFKKRLLNKRNNLLPLIFTFYKIFSFESICTSDTGFVVN